MTPFSFYRYFSEQYMTLYLFIKAGTHGCLFRLMSCNLLWQNIPIFLNEKPPLRSCNQVTDDREIEIVELQSSALHLGTY